MNDYLVRVSATARQAVSRNDWATVGSCAGEILKHDRASAEGHFLSGLVEKTSRRSEKASQAFAKALEIDGERYDAAIELAYLHSAARRYAAATALVANYQDKLQASPLYLNMAACVYTAAGLHERAWPLYLRASQLQPKVDLFQANLGTCAAFLGKIEEARQIYHRLLKRFPTHQQNHFTLAMLAKAVDRTHVEQMQEVLRSTNLSPDKNIFMHYAIGKELEDLEEWEEAFKYFKMGGDAVTSVADYDINMDLQLIDKIIDVCNSDWLSDGAVNDVTGSELAQPIFIVGLPRTGTTLTDRIVASHSKVQSVGETQFMQMVIRRKSGVESDEIMTPEMIAATAKVDIVGIGNAYMEMLNYRLDDEAMFVDKYPMNVLYLGFISKAFPNARIIHMTRNPMDSCFAMYKQIFTWAYKFSYTLEGLGQYYVAYKRLIDHWQQVLGNRLIEVEYESLVADQENQTRALLDKLGLEFEEACLNFDKNETATATASSIQVREKIHTGSVDRWRHYEKKLQPLREYLENAGIAVE